MAARPIFAWCFDHGTLHQFGGTPWCTASWVAFRTSTSEGAAEEAMEAKRAAYGDAVFFDDLPYDKKLEVLEIRETWIC